MRMTAAALLFAVALPASAEFTVVEETETMTVYRDGDHVIVLIDGTGGLDIFDVALQRAPEPPVSTPIRGEARDLGVRQYWSRIRLLDGALVCEKVAVRPAPEHRQRIVELIAAAPCRNGML